MPRDSGDWMEERALNMDADGEQVECGTCGGPIAPDGHCLNCEEIGIPNVEAIVWQQELESARRRLAEGQCPVCCTPLVVTDQEEFCPACER